MGLESLEIIQMYGEESGWKSARKEVMLSWRKDGNIRCCIGAGVLSLLLLELSHIVLGESYLSLSVAADIFVFWLSCMETDLSNYNFNLIQS